MPVPVGTAALAPVVEYTASMPAVYAVPTPVDEYISPMPTMCAATAPVVEYIAQAPAVSCVAPAPSVDVPGARKVSASLSKCAGGIGVCVWKGSSLRPLPKRRCRLADDETLPELYEIDEDEI